MPDLGKATYFLELNTAEFDSGMVRAEARATAATDAIAAQMGIASTSVEEMGVATSAAAGEVEGATASMEGSFAGAGAAAETMGADVAAGAATAGSASQAAATKTVTAWDAASKKMTAIGRKMKSVGREMTHKVTLPTAIVGAVAVKNALDYAEKIKLLQTQAGATGEEMEFMYKRVIDLAKSGKVTQTPNQLADALYHLESVGLRSGEALRALRAGANLATVGNASLEDSVNAVAGAWKVGIPGAQNFRNAVGTINAAIGAGNLRLDEYNSAMGTGILEAANNAGLSLAEVSAALASFTSRGLPAVQSMTALRMALSMLKAPTDKQAAAMKQMGFSNRLAIATMLRKDGLVPTMKLLQERYTKMVQAVGKERADEIFSHAFGGAKSGKALLAMTKGADALGDAYDQINAKTKDFTHLLAEAMGEPVNKMRVSMAKMSASLIGIGEKLVPIVEKIVNGLSRLFEWFDKLSPKAQKFILIGLGIAAALGPVLSIIGSLIVILPALGTALAALTGPVGIVLAVAAAFVILYIKCKRFREIVNATVAFVVRHWKSIGLIILWTINPLLALYLRFKWFRNAVNGIIKFLVKNWKHAITIMLMVAGPFIYLPILIIKHWRGFWNWLRDFAGDLVLLFTHPLDAIGKLWHDLVDGIKGAFRGIWNDIKGTLAAVVNGMISAVNVLIGLIRHIPVPTVTFKSASLDIPYPTAKSVGPSFHGIGMKRPGIGHWKASFKYPSFGLSTLGAVTGLGNIGSVGWGGGGGPSGPEPTPTPDITPSKGKGGKPARGPGAKPAPGGTGDTWQPGPGLGGEGAGGGGKSKKKKAEEEMFGKGWLDLEIKMAKAEHTKGLRDDLKILRQEETYLHKLLKQHGLSKERRLAILKKINEIDKAIVSTKATMKKRHKDAVTKAERRREAKLRKEMQAEQDRFDIAMAKLELKGGSMSEGKRKAHEEKMRKLQLRLITRQENFLKKRLKDKTLSLHEQAKIWKQIAALDKKRVALAKKAQKDQHASEAELAAVMNLRGSFFSEFAGNIFGKSEGGLTLRPNGAGGKGGDVKVEQHNTYNEIPRNRYEHARRMREAASSAMRGV